jgi:two-component system, chemotaxis family, response regulator Rcp1
MAGIESFPSWTGAPCFPSPFLMAPELGRDSEEAGTPRHPVPVFLVEDNPADVFVIRRALAAAFPVDLHIAMDGEEALLELKSLETAAPASRPWLILLDWNLPRVSGAEVLSYLRQIDVWKDTPVIIVTSTNSPSDVDEMRKLGANGHFQKPSDLEAYLGLAKVVATTLGRGDNIGN